MSTQVLEVLVSSTVSQVLEIPSAGPVPVVEVTVPAATGVVEIVTEGLQGPAGSAGATGATGLQGAPGAPGPGGVLAVTFTQSVASAEWIVTHAFSYRPDVETFDNSGEIFYADVSHPSPTTVRVTHGFPMTGSIRLL